MTTPTDIRNWLERGKAKGATHVIVACDTFDYEDYPVFVMPGENARDKARAEGDGPMTRVMECYDLSMDWDSQLAEYRAVHW